MDGVDAPLAAPPRLQDVPDWGYLLQEFAELYRRGKAGGSARIRAHQRAVREAIGRTLAANPPVLARKPDVKPVTAHLKRAFDQGRREVTQSVIRAIESVAHELAWLYGYEKVPTGLGKKYAYAEFAGPHGPVVTTEVILGVVLFAPKCTYPAHAHAGLTESYYTLSGAVSENDEGVYAPGSLIFNPPGRMHRITVGDSEPSLLAYAWHGPPDKLADQKMTFSRATRRS
ncbi:MAG: dimethlysulfonioproprionate lyase DddL [Rhodobacteraceae bacterium]|nr:MAG: dimethlysulfonioproprionate lyase DddL [Paracoccaceae bacterium]